MCGLEQRYHGPPLSEVRGGGRVVRGLLHRLRSHTRAKESPAVVTKLITVPTAPNAPTANFTSHLSYSGCRIICSHHHAWWVLLSDTPRALPVARAPTRAPRRALRSPPSSLVCPLRPMRPLQTLFGLDRHRNGGGRSACTRTRASLPDRGPSYSRRVLRRTAFFGRIEHDMSMRCISKADHWL